MEFEFDARKSHANKQKHGIDFMEAQSLWEDPALLEVPLRSGQEARFLLIGRIADKHWSAIVTYREERVRLISVRRSRADEKELYES